MGDGGPTAPFSAFDTPAYVTQSHVSSVSLPTTGRDYSFLSAPEAEDELGRLGRFRIMEELGAGGMGVVFLARQIGLNRLVAIKMIRGGSQARADHFTRFRIEAEAVARLRHPHVIQIYDIGEAGGLPFLSLELLDGDATIFQSLEGSFPQAGQGSLRALAGCFGFSGDDVEKRCRFLSGGEKARLVMAKMLYDPPNFLVLDEPTNHLDIATKEMLITALAQYEGTMLFVSHDRHFLAALSNRVLELTPEGVHLYGGGYTEYVASTGQEAPGLRS